jgi:hypothetical protein
MVGIICRKRVFLSNERIVEEMKTALQQELVCYMKKKMTKQLQLESFEMHRKMVGMKYSAKGGTLHLSMISKMKICDRVVLLEIIRQSRTLMKCFKLRRGVEFSFL